MRYSLFVRHEYGEFTFTTQYKKFSRALKSADKLFSNLSVNRVEIRDFNNKVVKVYATI